MSAVDGRLIVPDRRRPEPLWHQVEQAISAAITDGTWPAGSQLPGEDELTGLLGVSRITVRHALRNLEAAGQLRRERGRGTFVRDQRLVAGTRTLTSFSDEMAAVRVAVGATVIDSGIVGATGRTAVALGVPEGREVVRLQRLRLGDGQVIGLQTAHLLAERVPGFEVDELGDGSLYAYLRDRWGIVPLEAEEVFRVRGATRDEARLLEIRPGDPVFDVERVSADDRGPIEHTSSTMRADRYELRSSLRAPAASPAPTSSTP